eukprot:Blabericola_migrator_1__374@NODE_1093_length_5463_cov_81_535211_g748_i0_p4_GENE_NODE_1093_length_5463_cov_81_535211_g748_i0NODE_1093_length_5463_cov_81_535211_g748_i0_p4_ORF_typecomplete_len299_score59_68MAT1/PF06391_13/1_3e17zfRING_5/PF14634_6/0_00011zfRING_UBOX/PF13445_6/0_00011zfC3HC4_5/PF17121_5/0_00024zfC3HC4/PF00097_25/0_0055MVP_shoulder/PF11978_8/0_88MVP_shoulder/PF11978_8/14zfRING_2/PF13639_6/0_0083zfC3HC4_2/PF13923_6/0_021ProkRING_4/PF14447_6/34ProkRING_4/PF14447_6/1_5RNA_replicase_B/PF
MEEQAVLTKVCPVCREDYLTVFEVKLYRAGSCGHPICSRCLVSQGNAKLNKTGQWQDPQQVLKCLVCGVPSKAADWSDTSQEENLLEKEALVRTRVMSVLNCDRKSYETTPAFNEFLEQREDIIYDLVFSEDDELKAQRQAFLKQYEIEFQQKILEASERQRLREKQWIKEIVEREDVFYEIVNAGFSGGIKYNKQTDKKKFVHKLQQLHPQYFDVTDTTGTSAQASGAGAATEVSATRLAELHANQPTTIIPNIDYTKLKRKHNEDRYALMRAGGHRKEGIATKTRQEAIAFLSARF